MQQSLYVRSGEADLGSGYSRIVGSQGRYWSTTSVGSTATYYLDFTPTYVYPTFLDARYYGFSARCLASGAYVILG